MGDTVTMATGTLVSANYGVPSIDDMAINLPRLCRFAGNGEEWFSVGLHTFVVCDLLPAPLKVYGLLHDAPEGVGNDVPSPVKSHYTLEQEDKIFARLLVAHNLPPLTHEQEKRLKIADTVALWGEVWTFGPPAIRPHYATRVPIVEELTIDYARRFPPLDCIRRNGPFATEFKRRWEVYRAMAGDTRKTGMPDLVQP